MKYKALLLSLILVFTLLFSGCKESVEAPADNVSSQTISNNSSVMEEVDNITLYNQFVGGEITAKTDKGTFLYVNQFEFLENGFDYAFYDVDSDNVKELCVKNLQLYIFDVKDDKVYNLYTETRADSIILNDGALFQVQYGDSPKHTYYDYRKINSDGEIETQLYFSWWDAVSADDEESYFIDENKITKEEFDALWTQYSNFAADKVFWATVGGSNSLQNPVGKEEKEDEIVNQPDSYGETIDILEQEYEQELNNALSTADMCDVHIKYANKWKELSNNFYNRLIEDEDLKPYIIQLKTDWEVYYNSQIENYRNILCEVYDGGSITGVVFSSLERELQKEWALELLNIYSY